MRRRPLNPEVLIGAVIEVAGVLALALLVGGNRKPRATSVSQSALALATLVLVLLLHGHGLRAEPFIGGFAMPTVRSGPVWAAACNRLSIRLAA